MTIAIYFIIGVFAAWRLTWDITSCSRLFEEGQPERCEPNSEGPFQLYDGIRWFFHQDFFPEWVHRGIECPYCVSFWMGHFVALLFPVYGGLYFFEFVRAWLLFGIGISGVVALGFRLLLHFKNIDAQEF